MKKSITPDDLVFILSPLLEERINDAARREDDKAFAALQQARLQMERLLSPLRLSGVTALIDRLEAASVEDVERLTGDVKAYADRHPEIFPI
jgi:hypothetical protein